MTEKEQAQFEIMHLSSEITLAKADLFILCERYKEKWPEDLDFPAETILLDAPKKKRGRHKKKFVEIENK